MSHLLARLSVVALVAAALSACATAPGPVGSIPATPLQQRASAAVVENAYQTASAMPSGAEAAAPIGYVGFCARFADQCQQTAGSVQTLTLLPATWSTVEAINHKINNAIWAEDDRKHYGRAEFWTIPADGYGDCEDYALAKRQALMTAGLPESALRMAVVLAPDGGRHAVLTVSTDRGDYVLDNMSEEIRSWDRTPYVWLERQDSTKATGWASLATNPLILASAAAQGSETGDTH